VRIRTSDPRKFERALQTAARQIPFALSVGINDTAKEIQKYQSTYVQLAFNVRRQNFFPRAVKIKPFARKTRLSATLKIEPPGGPSRADMVTRHEEPGVRRPRFGSTLLVPVGARRLKSGRIRKTDRMEEQHFQTPLRAGRRAVASSGNVVSRGRRRTFMFRRPDGTGMVFRRTSSGRHGTFSGTEVLFVFKRRTSIHGGLQFLENARHVFDRDFQRLFANAYQRALETARP
jgi:hypothetical protein